MTFLATGSPSTFGGECGRTLHVPWQGTHVMAGQFWDIESIFEIEVPMLKYPVFLVGPQKPGFSSFIVHGSKGFADNGV